MSRPADTVPVWLGWVITAMAAAIVAMAVTLVTVVAADSDGSNAGVTSPDTSSTTLLATTVTTVGPGVLEPSYATVGVSGRGRHILGATFGDGPIRVYVLVGIHGDERAAVDTGPLLAGHWMEHGVPESLTIRFVPNGNPDGIVAATRTNGSGVDLNRNFPTGDFEPGDAHGPHALSEPESTALFADIEGFDPALIVTFHCEWNGPFANYDGPAGRVADAFAVAAGAIDPGWYVEPEVPYSTPGSLGTYYGKTLGLPVVTIEMSRHQTASEHWPAVRAGMDAVLQLAAGR